MNKCKWCGKSFEKSDLKKFIGGATLGIGGGEKYCSKSCEHSAEGAKESKSNFGSKSESIKNEDKSLELAEAQHEHERDLEEQRQEHELKLSAIKTTNNSIEIITNLDFGGSYPTADHISKDVELCLTLAASSIGESFDDLGEIGIREKFNQSEKIVNAAIKKAELGINKFKLCEPFDKSMNYYTVYREQLLETKKKHINRNYEIKIKESKPKTWIWIACAFFFPALIFPAFKLFTALVILPKQRDSELAKI